ncbi:MULTISPECIES: methyltransferase domain-containing protein [unclassified Chelatococcus]|uniref:methyltransferase domain-containing protein n=1 Tax=unclassified Chelatococcus TaxID=2638111 RepID=UPI001BCBEB65|nr:MULTISPECIES: methyltransferase domain-containing protein [unclassified Chelatococcus]MBS7697293.1 methyltransferase domain-containing protein [Chelatococcus sp. YT9]MBX3556410.1 methyltransferase domain-containing protein [Chelatococcus sp.]
MPILVKDPATFLSEQLVYALLPQDWPAALQDWFGEAFAQSSWFPTMQRHLSTYGWDHYGAGPDAAASAGNPQPGGVLACLSAGLDGMPSLPQGPVVDVGCACGRATFALAQRTDALVLGLDISIPLLRLAQQALRGGKITYPLRDIGNRFSIQAIAAPLPRRENVDFWVADAHHPPFLPASFGCLAALNLLDCVADPAQALRSMCEMMTEDGLAVLSIPYDWGEAATPMSKWIGGRMENDASAHDPESVLHKYITDMGCCILKDIKRQPWRLRIHRRSTVCYDSHVLLVRWREAAQ